jgi:hypothetical protein
MIAIRETPLGMDLLQDRQRRFHMITRKAPPHTIART